MSDKQQSAKTRLSGPLVSKPQVTRPQREKLRSKSTSSLPKKTAGESKPAPTTRKLKPKTRVELLNVPDVESKLPQVHVERTSSIQREQSPFLTSLDSSECTTRPMPETSTYDLSEPQLQSSLAVLEVLNRLKSLNIDSEALVDKFLREDQQTRHKIEKKASRATNVDSRTTVFQHLESLDIKDAELVEAEEKRKRQLAEHIAPRFPAREDEPKLSDFAEPYKVPPKPLLPQISSLNDELTKFGLSSLEPVTNRVEQDDLFVFRMVVS